MWTGKSVNAKSEKTMRFSYALVAGFVLACFAPAGAQPKPHTLHDEHLYELARTDLKAFAKEVSAGASSELGETHAIVLWLTQHFEWKETDYQSERYNRSSSEAVATATTSLWSLSRR